jgi:hypothetical protein
MRKILFSLVLFSFTFGGNYAKADRYDDFCSASRSQVPVNLNINYGEVEYLHDLKHSSFARYLRREMDMKAKLAQTVRGLTVAEASFGIQGNAEVTKMGNRYCVRLANVDVTFGYSRIVVLIDKKYKEKSCEYKVIKEHEDTHVYLNRQVLTEFAPRIKQKVNEVAASIPPRVEYTKVRAERALSEMLAKVQEAVKPDMAEFRILQDERNQAIDTKENYRATTNMCDRW